MNNDERDNLLQVRQLLSDADTILYKMSKSLCNFDIPENRIIRYNNNLDQLSVILINLYTIDVTE